MCFWEIYVQIDEDVLQDVVRLGFDRTQLVESLVDRAQNKATVAYYLVLDNRRRMSTGYQGAEFDAVKVSCQGHTAHSIMLYEQRHSV
jgi:hypothetical protein